MADYRYYTFQPRLGEVVVELPLYGVYMDKQINDAGNFTGTFRLGTDYGLDSALIAGTIPGRYGVVCRRDGVFVWAGMIWSRTYNSTARTVQLTAQTFESTFARLLTTRDLIYTNVEQSTIFNDIIVFNASDTPEANGLNYAFESALPTTGVTRSVNIPVTERRTIREALALLTGQDNGLSYTINYTNQPGTTDNVRKNIAVRNKGVPVSSGMAYDFPGTISRYWYSERGGATRHYARGTNGLIASADNTDLLNANWPLFVDVRDYPDNAQQTSLQSQANGDAVKFKPPIPNPTFELGSHSQFTGWNDLGKTFTVRIQDERFPDSITITSTLKGWSLNPESSDEAELVRLELEEAV